MTENLRDINGREIRLGDVLKLFHFRDRRSRRNVYMYRVVVRCNDKREIDPGGRWLFGVEICDIPTKGLDGAFKHNLQGMEVEIIDGAFEHLPDGGLAAWYDRPKVKTGDAGEG
jgi:hypothetical protein